MVNVAASTQSCLRCGRIDSENSPLAYSLPIAADARGVDCGPYCIPCLRRVTDELVENGVLAPAPALHFTTPLGRDLAGRSYAPSELSPTRGRRLTQRERDAIQRKRKVAYERMAQAEKALSALPLAEGTARPPSPDLIQAWRDYRRVWDKWARLGTALLAEPVEPHRLIHENDLRARMLRAYYAQLNSDGGFLAALEDIAREYQHLCPDPRGAHGYHAARELVWRRMPNFARGWGLPVGGPAQEWMQANEWSRETVSNLMEAIRWPQEARRIAVTGVSIPEPHVGPTVRQLDEAGIPHENLNRWTAGQRTAGRRGAAPATWTSSA